VFDCGLSYTRAVYTLFSTITLFPFVKTSHFRITRICCTSITIIAETFICNVDATNGRNTRIYSAFVVIVAIYIFIRTTVIFIAIIISTIIPIVAIYRGVNTTVDSATTVSSAFVVIVTVNRGVGTTIIFVAFIISTFVGIVAVNSSVLATFGHVAGIISTHVIIVTYNTRGDDFSGVFIAVFFSASIAIIDFFRSVNTSNSWAARVISARIVIIAVYSNSFHTSARVTSLYVASIRVINVNVRVLASFVSLTPIISTHVVIIAVN